MAARWAVVWAGAKAGAMVDLKAAGSAARRAALTVGAMVDMLAVDLVVQWVAY